MSAGLKYDTGKLSYRLIDPAPLAHLAAQLTYGAAKYAEQNWRELDNPKERYLDALMRHIEKLRSGEEYDPETGGHLHHCGAILCNAAFLCWFMAPRDLNVIAANCAKAIAAWKEKTEQCSK